MPGVIESYLHTGHQIGVLVELNCQSSTTAKTSEFKTLAKEIAMQIAANPSVKYIKMSDISDRVIREMEAKIEQSKLKQHLENICLYNQFYIRDNSITIEDLVKLHIAQLSEDISVKRFARFAIADSDNNPPNPPSDPSGGVPVNPFPISPTPLTSEAEVDV